MKKTATILITAVFCLTAACSTADAGSKADHVAAGIIIGAGAAIVGTTILQGFDHGRYRYDHRYRDYGPPVHYRSYKNRYRRDHRRYGGTRGPYRTYRDRGYWIEKRVWIPPVYENNWMEGRFTRNGRWISGRNERVLVREGHWVIKKRWVRD
ncbi:MAG: hypothetical protein ACQETC_08200 [Thermodesulfobacteriota bacterium]